jgi:serine O-acetyltransferase
MFDNIRADIALKKAWFLKHEGWVVRNLRVWIEPGTLAVLTYRYGRWVRRVKVPLLREVLLLPYALAKLLVIIVSQIYISSRSQIGKGLVIHNFSGIFLLAERVGNNCIVFQGVTVGHLRHTKGKRSAPCIGDNVFLGAGCKVLGDVTIGNNVIVGANSLVVTSVPDNSVVVGVPARVVQTDTNWAREKFEQIAAEMAHGMAPKAN